MGRLFIVLLVESPNVGYLLFSTIVYFSNILIL